MSSRAHETTAPVSPLELFRGLIRFDTSNPPANERLRLEYVARVLADSGVDRDRAIPG